MYTDFRFSFLSLALIGLSTIALTACNSDSGTGTAGTGDNKEKKDRGAASMMVGGTVWEAERSKARIRGASLKIDASRTDYVDGNVSRQQLVLMIPDYQGPGDYQAGGGSMFIGVGIDTNKARQAESDEQVQETVASVLGDASSVYLDRAEVTIISANDREIVGTFQYQPPEQLDRPKVTDGRFRALIDD